MDTHKSLQTSPFVIITSDRNGGSRSFFSILTGKYYEINKKNLQILEYCKYPRKVSKLLEQFEGKIIDELASNKLLADPSTVWEQTNIEYMEIEISTMCNWKCEYCPYTFDPKPPKVMDMDVYNEIIDKAQRHPTLETIAFNAFNEPTLDPYFEDRIHKLAQTDLKLRLFTNGSNLDERKIKLIKDTNVIEKIKFNLPSIDRTEFNRLTGSKLFERTMTNIERAISEGFEVEIIVNGTKEEVEKNISEIEKRFKVFDNVNVVHYITMDRAGLLKNKYAMNYYHKEELCGCSKIIKELNISVDGDFLICTMDYYQNDVFGNIKDGEISDILKSEKAQLIRKGVFGAETTPDDYICRKCWAIMLARFDGRYSKSIKPVLK